MKPSHPKPPKAMRPRDHALEVIRFLGVALIGGMLLMGVLLALGISGEAVAIIATIVGGAGGALSTSLNNLLKPQTNPDGSMPVSGPEGKPIKTETQAPSSPVEGG